MTNSDHDTRDEAVERLIELFTARNDSIDLDVLERIDELAWRTDRE